MPLKFKLIIYVVVFLLTSGTIGGVVYKWNSMEQQITTLTTQNTGLTQKVNQQKIDLQDQTTINDNIRRSLNNSNVELDKLRAKFKSNEYFAGTTLDVAAVTKTAETQQKLNDLINELYRCIEISTSAVKTEKEKGNEKTNICSPSITVNN